jgi:hemoglobin
MTTLEGTTNEHPEAITGPATLFERIGGRAGLEKIVPDVVQLHLDNPVCGARFRAAKKSPTDLSRLAIEFFATGLSGLASYDGLSMPEAHAGMGITEADYMAVLDDILAALRLHGIGDQEQAELLYIAYGMKSEIIGK